MGSGGFHYMDKGAKEFIRTRITADQAECFTGSNIRVYLATYPCHQRLRLTMFVCFLSDLYSLINSQPRSFSLLIS